MPVRSVTPTPMEALMAKVDAILRATGHDPDLICADDKILLAAQYIEVSTVLDVVASHTKDVHRL